MDQEAVQVEELMRRRLIPTLLLAVVAAACGSADAGDSVSGEDVVVRMFDNRFEYTEITITAGGTVTFRGAGRNPHNAVATDGSWSTEDVFGSLEQLEEDDATMSFDEPGVYPFFCTFHGNADGAGMAGTVIVEVSG